jgi:hypothetical protein
MNDELAIPVETQGNSWLSVAHVGGEQVTKAVVEVIFKGDHRRPLDQTVRCRATPRIAGSATPEGDGGGLRWSKLRNA